MDDDSPDYPDEGSPDTINDDYPEEESRYRSSNIDTGMSMSGTYSGENMDEDKSGDGMQDGVSFNILPLPLASLICLFCLCICLFVCLFATGGYEEEEDEEISPDLWQEACWIVIRLVMMCSY